MLPAMAPASLQVGSSYPIIYMHSICPGSNVRTGYAGCDHNESKAFQSKSQYQTFLARDSSSTIAKILISAHHVAPGTQVQLAYACRRPEHQTIVAEHLQT